jgi:hypothetical protein
VAVTVREIEIDPPEDSAVEEHGGNLITKHYYKNIDQLPPPQPLTNLLRKIFSTT